MRPQQSLKIIIKSKIFKKTYKTSFITCDTYLLKGGLPPFPLSHLMTNGYFYYQKQLSYFDGPCHYWPNLHIYGAMNIDDDITCSDDGYLRKYTILCQISTKQWLHSPCYWDIWVSSFSFWFIIDCLCINHYCASSIVFFNPFDVHFSLSTSCVHSLATGASHNKFSTSYSTWSQFFIFSTHHS
jgi:hypothetical protein